MVMNRTPNRTREERQLRGWTQAVLSDKSGICQSHICEYEIGVVFPGPKNIQRLADAFGVSAPEMFAWLMTPAEEEAAA